MSPSNFFDSGSFLDETPSNGGGTVTPVPKTISDLFAWYDAATIDTILDGSVFTTLIDQSGAGHNAVAPGDPQRPRFDVAKINQPAAVHFGEVPLLNMSSALATAGELTMFFVYKSDEPDPINTLASSMSVDGIHIGWWLTMNEQGQVKWYQGTEPSSHKFTGTIRLGHRAYHVIVARRTSVDVSNDNVTLWVDAVSEGTTMMGKGDATSNQAVLGNAPGGSAHGVLMAESLFYTRSLSDLEVQRISQYLLAKHNANLSLGSLNELGTGIPGPGVARYAQNRTVVEALNSVVAPGFNYADLLSWFDAPQIQQLTGEVDGDSIPRWKSSAGAAGVELDAFNDTVAQQPIFRVPGVGGLPTVGFTGTIDSATSKRLQLSAGLDAVSDLTFFVVFRHRETPVNAVFGSAIISASKDDTGQHIPFILSINNADKIQWHQATTSYFVHTGTTALSKDKFHVLSVRRKIGSGRNVTVRIDGLEEFNVGPAFDADTVAGVEGWLGNCSPTNFLYPLIGEIGELLYYNRVLDDTETTDMERNLIRKWGPHIEMGDLRDLTGGGKTLVAEINTKT